MATILPFTIRPRAQAQMRLVGADAAIIIFPGVRYEKAEPPASAVDASSPGTAPRKGRGKAAARVK